MRSAQMMLMWRRLLPPFTWLVKPSVGSRQGRNFPRYNCLWEGAEMGLVDLLYKKSHWKQTNKWKVWGNQKIFKRTDMGRRYGRYNKEKPWRAISSGHARQFPFQAVHLPVCKHQSSQDKGAHWTSWQRQHKTESFMLEDYRRQTFTAAERPL